MPCRLRRGKPVMNEIRRVVEEQIRGTIDELNDSGIRPAETIHQVRKRCKKVRGALRLVRDALGDEYAFENAWFRDAAQALSPVRDAKAMIETYDALSLHCGKAFDGRVMRPVRRTLVDRRDACMSDTTRVDELLAVFETRMQAARTRLAAWTLHAEGYGAVSGGLRRTYARARKAMAAAYDARSPESYHEWRKRVKYHWYHMRLLREVWPAVMRARRDEAHRLGDLLGDHHNLSVFRDALEDSPEAFAKEATVAALVAIIDRRRVELETQAEPLGSRLFAEKPKHFVRRLGSYWEAASSDSCTE